MSAVKRRLPGNAKTRPVGPAIVPTSATITHITVDSFIVGPAGIVCTDPNYKWDPPTVMLDDLDKLGRLGTGKQGDVYKYCRKDNPNVKYALKVIRLREEDAGSENIVRELRAALDHRIANTVTLENAYVVSGKLVLIMEYMNFGTLQELLEQVRARTAGGPGLGGPEGGLDGLPPDAVAWIASQLVTALRDLNAPIAGADGEGGTQRAQIHRDITPANILLSRDGVVKLADFGVATSADSIGASTFTGSVSCMSPERLKGHRHGPPADIWSVGIVIAEALLGRFPFASAEGGLMPLLKEIQSTRPTIPGASPASQAFVDHCCQLEAENRWTAAQLMDDPFVAAGLGMQESLRHLIRRLIRPKQAPAQTPLVATEQPQ